MNVAKYLIEFQENLSIQQWRTTTITIIALIIKVQSLLWEKITAGLKSTEVGPRSSHYEVVKPSLPL